MTGIWPPYIEWDIDKILIPKIASTHNALILVINPGLIFTRRLGIKGAERVKISETSVESGVAIWINTIMRIIVLEGTVLIVVCSRGKGSGCVSANSISVDGMNPILRGLITIGLGIMVHLPSQYITTFGRYLITTLLTAIQFHLHQMEEVLLWTHVLSNLRTIIS